MENLDELCEPYPDGTPSRASFASDKWAEEVKRELRIFIAHIQESEYASHIVGYQVAGGNTEGSERVKELAKQNCCAVMEIKTDNCFITPAQLRTFIKKAGVWVYCDRDAVIYANDRHLFLHTVEDGEYTLAVDKSIELVDVFTGEPFLQGQRIQKGKSFIFSLRNDNG